MNGATLNASRYSAQDQARDIRAALPPERIPPIPAAVNDLEKVQASTDELLNQLRLRLACVTELNPAGLEGKAADEPPGLLGRIVTRYRAANDINRQLQQLLDGLQL